MSLFSTGVRSYKRSSEKQEKKVSDILNNAIPTHDDVDSDTDELPPKKKHNPSVVYNSCVFNYISK